MSLSWPKMGADTLDHAFPTVTHLFELTSSSHVVCGLLLSALPGLDL